MMKQSDLGKRIARARTAAGKTQRSLADDTGLERSLIAKIERGTRRVEALELLHIARALEVSLDWLLADSLPIVVSGRGALPGVDEAKHAVRAEVIAVEIARDLNLLLEQAVLKAPAKNPHGYSTGDVREAERLAREVRDRIGEPGSPLLDLGFWTERLGLHCVSEDRGELLPLGLYRSLGDVGVAWINGRSPAGQRRFTLAHELGHHLLQDEYSLDWSESTSEETERWINAFAIHLLLPRRGAVERWSSLVDLDDRARAIVLAAEYGVSWSAACAQIVRLDLVSPADGEALRERRPTKWEQIELEVSVPEELTPPYVSPEAASAVVKLYRRSKLSATRAVEMLRGTVTEEELPPLPDIPLDAYLPDLDPLE